MATETTFARLTYGWISAVILLFCSLVTIWAVIKINKIIKSQGKKVSMNIAIVIAYLVGFLMSFVTSILRTTRGDWNDYLMLVE
jgi:hypothetical protein